ncbi:DUF6407 family protein [Mesobacillus foraminis]
MHIQSIMEGTILLKIIEVSRNNKTELDIEVVYEGHVVRDYLLLS